MGKRMSFADLAAAPILDAPVPPISVVTPPPAAVALREVAPNPINPRQRIGDLTELAASLRSIGQLQPCTVVTRAAYLTQYPEHAAATGSSSYVAVTGGRRRAAAELAGLATLDIAVRDSLAESRETLYAASITENIEREDFDVLDEARAVQKLVEICGDGVKAGERLSRSKGWVSQRLALLKLSPDMQEHLRAGDLLVRDARRLARLDPAAQLPAWRSEQEVTATRDEPQPRGHHVAAATSAGRAERASDAGSATPRAGRNPAAAVAALGSTPEAIAKTLREFLAPADRRRLAELLVT